MMFITVTEKSKQTNKPILHIEAKTSQAAKVPQAERTMQLTLQYLAPNYTAEVSF